MLLAGLPATASRAGFLATTERSNAEYNRGLEKEKTIFNRFWAEIAANGPRSAWRCRPLIANIPHDLRRFLPAAHPAFRSFSKANL